MRRICLLIVSIFVCSMGVTSAFGQDKAALAGDWLLQPVLASDTSTNQVPSIHFDLTTGHFTGFTGCNRMSGDFAVKGVQLTFSPDVALTKMACQGYNEKGFITNLLRVTQYTITQGVLELRIGNTPISRWVRKIERPPLKKTA